MDRLAIPVLAGFSLAVASFSSLAGECNCKTEIDNASAKVSGSCGKVWQDNHCTLKESDASSSNVSPEWQATIQSIVPQPFPIYSGDPFIPAEAIFDPRLRLQVLNSFLVNLMGDLVRPEFAAGVISALNANGGEAQISTFMDSGGIETFSAEFPAQGNVAITRGCIYAEDPESDASMYLNWNVGDEVCPVEDMAARVN